MSATLLDRLSLVTHRRLFVLCAFAMLLPAALVGWSMDVRNPDSLRVFGSYWASGWAISHSLDPYAVQPHTWIYEIRGLGMVDLNLNPPVLLPLFQLLARLDLVGAARLWLLASYLLFIATTAIMVRDSGRILQRRQIIWLFGAPAAFDTLILGQIYIGLFALSTLGWLCLAKRRFLLAGVAIGLLVAIKPTFALWPMLLFLAGHRKPALAAALICGITSLVPAVLYGPAIYTQWLTTLAADHHSILPTDASVQGYFGRIRLGPLGPAVALTLVLSVMVWVWRRRFSPTDVSGLALAVTILASPLSWMHYTLVLVPALIERPWTKSLNMAAMLLAVPVVVPLQAIGRPLWVMALLGGLYLAAAVLILGALAARLRRAAPIAEARPASMTSDHDMIEHDVVRNPGPAVRHQALAKSAV